MTELDSRIRNRRVRCTGAVYFLSIRTVELLPNVWFLEEKKQADIQSFSLFHQTSIRSCFCWDLTQPFDLPGSFAEVGREVFRTHLNVVSLSWQLEYCVRDLHLLCPNWSWRKTDPKVDSVRYLSENVRIFFVAIASWTLVKLQSGFLFLWCSVCHECNCKTWSRSAFVVKLVLLLL